MVNSLCCDRFEERVQSLMDQRVLLKDDPQLQSHAQGCESCSGLLESFLALEVALNQVFPASGAGIAAEVFAVDGKGTLERPSDLDSFVYRTSGNKRKRTGRWGVAVSALAAAVVLFLLVPNWLAGERSIAGGDSAEIVALDSAAMEAVDPPKQYEKTQLSILPENAVNRFEMVSSLPVSLRNAYGYAVELPGVRPLECSVNVTIEMLQRSFGRFSGEKQIEEEKPDLGYFADAWQFRTV